MRFLTFGFIVFVAASASAQSMRIIYNFGTNLGDPIYGNPISAIAQGKDGAFYGATTQGGLKNGSVGCVYRLTSDGKLTILHSFLTATDGASPTGGVTLGSDGNMFGTCYSGSTYGVGSIWKVTPTGTFSKLCVLTPANGSYPISAPVLGADGNFYGVTDYIDNFQYGEFYRVSSTGSYTPLYSFKTATTTTGMMASAVSRGVDGNFYGTTFKGGKNYGTVFKATPAGQVQGLHSFDGTNGSLAYNVMQASDGNLYGTCATGGTGNFGLVYKLTTSGTFTVLHNFAGTDGFAPVAGLVQGKDGYLYGATKAGGTGKCGVIFRILPSGQNFEVVYTRAITGLEGSWALSTPIFGADGNLYGTTYGGGTKLEGVFYDVDLTTITPSVSSAKVGTAITIKGLGLTGATSVSFNGVAASPVTVTNDQTISVTVPTGATTGIITVTAPSGTHKTLSAFTVTS